MRITINTPSGNIGRAVADTLLHAGHDLTVISRNPDKVADLVARGARLVEGSTDDSSALDAAFEGADAALWISPPAVRPDYKTWSENTARAAAAIAAKRGVRRVVVVSSVGAHTGDGTGPVSPMLGVERAWQAALANVLVLRPGFFMENLLRSASTIASQGAIYQPVAADKPVPMIATRDIAQAAADELADGSWGGHRVRGLHGPEDLDYGRTAEILGEALGRPVQYVRVTVDQARQAMLDMGMPAFAADMYTQLYRAIDDGRMDAAEPRTVETTTPTTLAQFAREVLAPAIDTATA